MSFRHLKIGDKVISIAPLVDRTGEEIAPAFMIMAAAAVTFATLLWFRETYRKPFIGGSSGAAAAYA